MALRMGWLMALAALPACWDAPTDRPPTAPPPEGCGYLDPADELDEDDDGILAAHEGNGDADGDGLVNDQDTDADGDGWSDREETGERRGPCYPAVDTDRDTIPDHLDTDSDADGLPDADELAVGSDPRNVDSDADGCPDGAEEPLDDCADPRDLPLIVGCTAPSTAASFPWDGPALTTASLRLVVPDDVEGHFVFETFADAVYPAGAASLSGGLEDERDAVFVDVQPGAVLVFGVDVLDVRATTARTEGRVELLGPAGEVLDRGRLLILGEQSCLVRRP